MNQNILQLLLLANLAFSILTDTIRRGTDLHMAMGAVYPPNRREQPNSTSPQTAERVIYLTPRQPNDRGLSPPSPVVKESRGQLTRQLNSQRPLEDRGAKLLPHYRMCHRISEFGAGGS
jgi:hypothetical protein